MSNLPKRRQRKRKGSSNTGGGGGAQVGSTPAAYSNTIVSSRPRSMGASTRERGRIKLADLAGSTSFAATKYSVNPGLSGVFGTRLANIATGYEKYCFLEDLELEYVPSQAVTTTAGTVYLAADYDPTDPVPASDTDLSTYETWSSTNVFRGLRLRMLKSRAFDGVQHKLVRTGPVSGDLLLRDAGSFIVATDDCANTNDLGKLYLHYSFIFFSPQTSPSSYLPPNISVFGLSSSQTFTTTTAAALDFDEVVANGMSLTDSSGVYTLPPGSFVAEGLMTVKDTSAEAFNVYAEAYVDGAVMAPPQAVQFTDTVAASAMIVIPFVFYFTSSASSTFQVLVTMTGSAGTLSAIAAMTRLVIRAV